MKRKNVVRISEVALLVFIVVSCRNINKKNSHSVAAADNTEINSFTNPILPYGPDPWALYHEGQYFYMHTMVDSLVLWKTKDVTDLKSAERKTIWVPTYPSNSGNLWAPEVHNFNGKWYLYYAADDGNTDNHQLYVLENSEKDSFDGEFIMKGRISTDPDNNWAIDVSLFEHQNKLYMVWSGWQTRRIDTET